MGRNVILMLKCLHFVLAAPAASAQMLTHCSHDNPSFCSLVSIADNMSSPVHVPDSTTHKSNSSSSFSLAIYLTNTINCAKPDTSVDSWLDFHFHSIIQLALNIFTHFTDTLANVISRQWYSFCFLIYIVSTHNLTGCNSSKFDECFSDGMCFFSFAIKYATSYDAFWDIFKIVWYFAMDFFSLDYTFSDQRKKVLVCKLKYYATQSGRSRNPSLGRDPLLADPCHG